MAEFNLNSLSFHDLAVLITITLALLIITAIWLAIIIARR